MPTTYFVDSRFGSDANAGTSPELALKSFAAVEQLQLQPGDTVLLARGSTFSEQLDIRASGVATAPITFGAYGTGDHPLISAAGHAISGSKTSWIEIRDIAITETGSTAIYAGYASNWVIDNVTITDQAGGTATQGISFQHGANLTVRNATIEGMHSDGIWIDDTTGVLLENNRIGTVHGANSDNIQVANSRNVVVRGNTLEIGPDSDTTKGNVTINKSSDVIVADNEMSGGGYGASINSDHVVVTGNTIRDQGGYDWSFGIGAGERWSVSDYLIADNTISNVRFGVALTGIGDTPVVRDGIEITNNVFENNEGAALKVDRPSIGSFHDNFVHVDTPPLRIAPSVIEAGTFATSNTKPFVNSDPIGNVDSSALGETGTFARGNLLANDESLTHDALRVTGIEGFEVGAGTSVAGRYGTLVVDADGSYIYALDPGRMLGVAGTVTEHFQYAMSDGRNEGLSELVIEIAPRPNVAPVAAADFTRIAGLAGETNVLGNDTDANGDTLRLVSFGEHAVPTLGPVRIEGRFGTLTVTEDGSVSYALDPVRASRLKADTVESFDYVAADGRGGTAEGLLAITIEAPKPHPPQAPVAINDGIRLSAFSDLPAVGSVLANDYDPNGDIVYLRTLGSTRVADHTVRLEGRYGDLFFESDGDYRYVVDHDRVDLLQGTVKESFFYKISDGSLQDTGSLTVTIDFDRPALPEPDAFGLV